jgi:hypothetical protein
VRDVTRFLVAADRATPTKGSAGALREDATSLQFRFVSDRMELHRQALAK